MPWGPFVELAGTASKEVLGPCFFGILLGSRYGLRLTWMPRKSWPSTSKGGPTGYCVAYIWGPGMVCVA